jgi:hypothetical protein
MIDKIYRILMLREREKIRFYASVVAVVAFYRLSFCAYISIITPHTLTVLLPENLHTYFELSVQAWILYKAPQWNARYPTSCPERIKLKMH